MIILQISLDNIRNVIITLHMYNYTYICRRRSGNSDARLSVYTVG